MDTYSIFNMIENNKKSQDIRKYLFGIVKC